MNRSFRRHRLPTILALAILLTLSGHIAHGQSLEEAVSLTLITHPKLQQALHKLQEYKHDETVAKSGYLPTLDLHAGIGYERTDNPAVRSGGPTTDEYLRRREMSVVLRQVIFEGFSTLNNDRRTKAATHSGQYRLLNTASEMALDVTRSYLTILMQQNALKMARQNLDAHEEIYYSIFKRSEQGVQSIADLSQIRGRLARAQSSVIAAENNLNDAQTQFLKLTGVQPENLTEPEPDTDLIPETLDDTLRVAASDYPLLHSATLDQKAATYEYEACKGRFFPELSIEAIRSWNQNLNGIKGRDDDYTIMFHARYNLFSGGRDTGQMRAALSRREQAWDIYSQAKLQVEEEARLSWDARQQLRRQLPRLEEHFEAIKSTVKAYRRQFVLGERTLLDVLNAENEKLEASLARNRAITYELEAEYRLLHITGKLLDSLKFTLPAGWIPPEKSRHEKADRSI